MFTKKTLIKIVIHIVMAIVLAPIYLGAINVAALLGSLITGSWRAVLAALILTTLATLLAYIECVDLFLYGDKFRKGLLSEPKKGLPVLYRSST